MVWQKAYAIAGAYNRAIITNDYYRLSPPSPRIQCRHEEHHHQPFRARNERAPCAVEEYTVAHITVVRLVIAW